MNPDDSFGYDQGVDEEVVDPVALLRAWLAHCDGDITPLMTLATIGPDGYPNSRHVLLSRCDEAGRIAFHTDARSRKAAELAANPRASVAVVWPGMARQLVVTGDVAVQGEPERPDAFARRSRYLQLLAWLNEQGLADARAEVRRGRWAAFDAAHPDLEPPETWVGYALTPRRIAFWRGATDGPSNRVLCSRTATGWRIERRPG